MSSYRLPRGFIAKSLTLKEYLILQKQRSWENQCSLCRAEQDLARFFSDQNREVLEIFLQVHGVSQARLLQSLEYSRAPKDLLDGIPWAELLGCVLSGSWVRESVETNEFQLSGLSLALAPFIRWAARQVKIWTGRDGLRSDSLTSGLLNEVHQQLFHFAKNVFVLEANISLIQARSEQDCRAASAKDAFADAIRRSPLFLQRLYLRYASLSRLIATVMLQWKKNTQLLLDRLEKDEAAIRHTFGIEQLGALTSIDATLSDRHSGGQSVRTLNFSCGLKLLYKPRCVKAELAYQRLLSLLNLHGLDPSMQLIKVLHREDYGWVEYIEHRHLDDEAALSRFYRRHGTHLAILYILKGVDFHAENIIACGEQPILVDLETLLHGDLAGTDREIQGPAARALFDSVFATGLLPGWSSGEPDQPGPDYSGIGAYGEQLHLAKSDVIEDDEDGFLKLTRQSTLFTAVDNHPFQSSTRSKPINYTRDILRGFRSTWSLLTVLKSSLHNESGILKDLVAARLRHVPVGTIVYSSLLRRSLHPDFLQRTVHRELIFSCLVTRSRHQPAATSLIASECIALLRGDIPKFLASPTSCDLEDDTGKNLGPCLARQPILELHHRTGMLNEDSMNLQQKLIELAMATQAIPGDQQACDAPPVPVTSIHLDDSEVRDEVSKLAKTLSRWAFIHGDQIGWIGIKDLPGHRSELTDVGAELYDGVAGIGVFLAQAGRILGEDSFLEVAWLCGQTIESRLELEIGHASGGFSGLPGMAYGIAYLSLILNHAPWLEQAIEVLLHCSAQAASDELFDLISGSAGLCAVLRSIWKKTGDHRIFAAMVAPADRLLERATDMKGAGLAWQTKPNQKPLTGMSHGASGIGWALAHMGFIHGREDWILAAKKAFTYERNLYSLKEGGWPDLRESSQPGQATYPLAWCHGGPGIGIARASLPKALLGPEELSDLKISLKALFTSSLASSDCLCHGELGNLELLLLSSELFHGRSILDYARKRAATALQRSRNMRGWRCGAIPNEPVPGLMTGLAGIGYGLMRVLSPTEVPCVLTLDSP